VIIFLNLFYLASAADTDVRICCHCCCCCCVDWI